MNKFNRGIINPDFINALNDLYNDKNSFWYKMVNHQELFIAIRDKYLNVYYNGQSICKLDFNKKKVRGKTHKKYLGVNEEGYFTSEDGNIINEKSKIKPLSDIELIKDNVNSYVGTEKRESYAEILNNEKSLLVLDVEITLVKNLIEKPIKKSDYEVSSIDYVTLEYSDDKRETKLVFYEAKHFSNPEIRSRITPRVIEQITRYEKALHEHENEIIKSYNCVIQNLIDLHILAYRGITDFDFIEKKMSIDFEPRLIIFGIDKDNENDSHLNRLRAHFGKRLILKHKKKNE